MANDARVSQKRVGRWESGGSSTNHCHLSSARRVRGVVRRLKSRLSPPRTSPAAVPALDAVAEVKVAASGPVTTPAAASTATDTDLTSALGGPKTELRAAPANLNKMATIDHHVTITYCIETQQRGTAHCHHLLFPNELAIRYMVKYMMKCENSNK